MSTAGEDWARVEALLPDALALAPPEREAFLRRHCGPNTALRAELESLLTAGDTTDKFLSRPIALSLPGAEIEALPAGTSLGAWRILEPIGRGGMGEVYAAERADGQFKMPAAIKVLKRGLDTDALLRRFLRERNILARLAHPNIARMLDAGATPDGRPYFVMERVQGLPITGYCQAQKLSAPEILRLMRNVCEAVDAAHRSLIVHRDLKPSNVLVTAVGEVKLLDFGVAKLVAEDEEDNTRTVASSMLLTPSYAAPEQILGEPVSTATDVYALGAMLYQLLVGRLPHQREGLPMALLAPNLRHETVERPSSAVGRVANNRQRARELSGDLDLIVLKALQADPQRRYRSAYELGQDLLRYLEHRPVEARPDSPGYRINRFLRRYPVPVAAATVAVLALITGMGAALWQARIALAAEAEAIKALATAKAVSDFVTQDLLASVNPNQRSTANITLREMLDIAVGQVDKRFAGQPQVAAELHHALGKSYEGLGMQQERHDQHKKSAALFEKVLGRDSERTLDALERQAYAKKWIGDYAGELVILQELIQRRTQTLGANSPRTLRIRFQATWLMHELGDWPALAELQAIVEAMARDQGPLDDLRPVQLSLVSALSAAAEYEQAERLCRSLLLSLKEVAASKQLTTLMLDRWLARVLLARGRYQEAEQILSQLRAVLPGQVPAGHAEHRFLENAWAELHLEQGRLKQSIASAQALLQRAAATEGIEENISYDPLIILAGAYLRSGQYQEALAALRKIEAAPDKWFGEDHPLRVSVRTMLADALRGAGHAAEASEALNSISPIALSRLPPRHPFEAERLRVQGLLWLAADQPSEAGKALAESLKIYEFRLGPDHWRTQRAREELAR